MGDEDKPEPTDEECKAKLETLTNDQLRAHLVNGLDQIGATMRDEQEHAGASNPDAIDAGFNAGYSAWDRWGLQDVPRDEYAAELCGLLCNLSIPDKLAGYVEDPGQYGSADGFDLLDFIPLHTGGLPLFLYSFITRTPKVECESEAVEEFWAEPIGQTVIPRMDDPEFVRGLIVGVVEARDFWREEEAKEQQKKNPGEQAE